MTEMEIRLSKSTYMPGERVEGQVVVATDKKIECKKLRFFLMGWAGYWLPSAYYKKDILDLELVLSDGAVVIESGEVQYNFSFVLPNDAPPTYFGHPKNEFGLKKGGIDMSRMLYNIIALADIAGRISDERAEDFVKVVLPSSSDRHPSQSQSATLEHKGAPLIRIELENNQLALGEQCPLRVWVGMKAKKVELELVHLETVKSVGWKKPEQESSHVCIARPNSDVGKLPREIWTDVVFDTDSNWPEAFNSEYIDSIYAIRVAAKTGWFGGQELEIPLRTSGGTIASVGLDWFSFAET